MGSCSQISISSIQTIVLIVSSVQLKQNAPLRTIAKEARELIRKHGTPIRLLRDFYDEVGANLILLNGKQCVQRWEHPTPLTDDNGPLTVVLNFWDHHVFSYDATANKAASNLRAQPLDDWMPKSLASRREGKDEHLYDNIKEKLEVLEKEEERGMTELRGGWNFAGRQG